MTDCTRDHQPGSSSFLQLPDDSSEWLQEKIVELSQYTDTAYQGHTRLAFSKEDRNAREVLIGFMKEVGLEVMVDPAGNIIGKRPGKEADRPFIMTGSHIDTVKDGGRFDGIAGVISGILAIRCLGLSGVATNHPIEVVSFTSEEPNEFGISAVGSRAMAGELSEDILTALKNKEGLTLGQAIESVGGDPDRITQAPRRAGDILAYVELHIEQGPILENLGIPIGIVKEIAGIYRGQVSVIGSADHAGTTPMNVRKDALVAAAEVIQALERIVKKLCLEDTVATIGFLDNHPNATNVVPGRVVMHTDVRGKRLKSMDLIEGALEAELGKISTRRGIGISFQRINTVLPVVMDDWVVRLIEKSCQDCAIPYHLMASGAGHDANHISGISKAGMIFVRSRGGKSHCPKEWSDFRDIALGAQALVNTIMKLDETGKESV